MGMSARRRVAVVDDDQSVRRALRRLLRSADLDTEAYGSGGEFLAALSDNVPDCLVLDLQMPDMNGLELHQYLSEKGIRLPVIVITGYDEPGMRARCMAAGVATYLRKPLEDEILLEAINNAITNAENAEG
jgi:FixJ family two-component response regulator